MSSGRYVKELSWSACARVARFSSPFNQSYHWIVALPWPSSFLRLPNQAKAKGKHLICLKRRHVSCNSTKTTWITMINSLTFCGLCNKTAWLFDKVCWKIRFDSSKGRENIESSCNLNKVLLPSLNLKTIKVNTNHRCKLREERRRYFAALPNLWKKKIGFWKKGFVTNRQWKCVKEYVK